MEDSQVVTSFLHALYWQQATGWIEIRYLADREQPIRRWYRPQKVPLDKLQAGNQAGRNVYFVVGLRRKRDSKKATSGPFLLCGSTWTGTTVGQSRKRCYNAPVLEVSTTSRESQMTVSVPLIYAVRGRGARAAKPVQAG